jgi:hypothetical protein
MHFAGGTLSRNVYTSMVSRLYEGEDVGAKIALPKKFCRILHMHNI